MPDSDLMAMIDDSYDLVVNGLKKADRLKLENVYILCIMVTLLGF